jgi:hypothetical protein
MPMFMFMVVVKVVPPQHATVVAIFLDFCLDVTTRSHQEIEHHGYDGNHSFGLYCAVGIDGCY